MRHAQDAVDLDELDQLSSPVEVVVERFHADGQVMARGRHDRRPAVPVGDESVAKADGQHVAGWPVEPSAELRLEVGRRFRRSGQLRFHVELRPIDCADGHERRRAVFHPSQRAQNKHGAEAQVPVFANGSYHSRFLLIIRQNFNTFLFTWAKIGVLSWQVLIINNAKNIMVRDEVKIYTLVTISKYTQNDSFGLNN